MLPLFHGSTAVIANSKEYENVVRGSVIFILAKYLQKYSWTCLERRLLNDGRVLPFLKCAVVSLSVYFVVVIWITKCVSLVRTNESLCAKVLFSIAVVTKVTPLKPCDMIVLTELEKETNLIPSDSRAHNNSRLCRYLTHAHSHIHRVVAAMDSCFSSAWHNRWTPVESFRTRLWPCRGRTAMPCRWALRNGELSRISGWYGCAHGLGLSQAVSWCRYVTCFWVFREKETFFALSLQAKKMKWESQDHVNVDWEIMRNSQFVRLRLVPHFPPGWLSEQNWWARLVKIAARRERQDACHLPRRWRRFLRVLAYFAP